MTYFEAILLGAVQGLTEFLPISSSGHLIFIPKIFGWADHGIEFDALLHVATLLAVVFFFRKRLFQLMVSAWNFRSKSTEHRVNHRLLIFLAFSTLPAGLFGFFLGDWIEMQLRAPWIIGVNMVVWGIILGISEWYSNKKSSVQRLEDIQPKNVWYMALAQALALFPGTSRSGITMTLGMFSGVSKKTAVEFSFLMSIPIIAMAGAFQIFEIVKNGSFDFPVNVFALGFFSALVSGIFALSLLMKIIEKWNFSVFVVYRIVIGLLIFIFLV